MTLPKPLSIKDLIAFLESHRAECEETLRVLTEAELQHPEHIKVRESIKERIEKEIKEIDKDLEKLRKIHNRYNKSDDEIVNLTPCESEECRQFRLAYHYRPSNRGFGIPHQTHVCDKKCCAEWERKYREEIEGKNKLPEGF